MAIGSLFLLLKFYEWHIDISEHLFPAGQFKISGADAGGARMFWSFYFVATALHAAAHDRRVSASSAGSRCRHGATLLPTAG